MLRPPRLTLVPFSTFEEYATYYNGPYYPNGTRYSSSPWIEYYPSFYSEEEYIDDERSRKNADFSTMKPCVSGSHGLGKWADAPGGTPNWYWDLYVPAWGLGTAPWVDAFGSVMAPFKGLPVLLQSSSPKLVLAWPSDYASYVSLAIKAMLPGIKSAGGVSLVNSIYELKDVHTIAPSVRKAKLAIQAIGSLVRSRFKSASFAKRKLRQLLRATADGYLQAEFNILPLLSDIASVKLALSDYRSKLKSLIDRANKPQKVHWKRPLLAQYPTKYEYFPKQMPAESVCNVLGASRSVRYVCCDFSATMEYSYSLPSLSLEDNLLKALLDRLGVNLSPRIIWNAIPWSFVVDWVANVGSYLDNFTKRNIEPIVNIQGFCYSLHVKRSIDTAIGPDNSLEPCIGIFEDAYERVVPDRSAMLAQLRTSGLDLKELSLLGALVFSR